jgi:hypothetical protein
METASPGRAGVRYEIGGRRASPPFWPLQRLTVPKSTTLAQLGLLDWVAPEPVARFGDDQVRACSIADRLCRAVSLTLKENGLPRSEIARRMSDFLGQKVGENMLNAYASQAREDHIISVVRFIALLHATDDRRLLELIAEMFGWTVIERKFLRLIELAAVQEQEDVLRRRRKALRGTAKREGLI